MVVGSWGMDETEEDEGCDWISIHESERKVSVIGYWGAMWDCLPSLRRRVPVVMLVDCVCDCDG
jgi:hypothetical protein